MRDIDVTTVPDSLRLGDDIVLFADGKFTPPVAVDEFLIQGITGYEGLERILLVGRSWPPGWTQDRVLEDLEDRIREVAEISSRCRGTHEPNDLVILNVHITALHEALDDYQMGLVRQERA